MPAKTTIISVNTVEIAMIAVLFLLVSVAFAVKGVVQLKLKKIKKDKIYKSLKIKLQKQEMFPFLALALF